MKMLTTNFGTNAREIVQKIDVIADQIVDQLAVQFADHLFIMRHLNSSHN